ncbi:DUF4394 domain-containing protein [Lentzea flava]|uniref:DUF4394 domain-containing protein n=1 Tax=Lentzea flava TaxID=103732 RepID=A0ABQ2UEW3_9PSEU|nr:DUF4394 domain-containing protein [Lentzea flava]MCP2200982.1 protein of unknown function (DUF4394) [Lentzea flava]GGU27406.1 hypothetical protein GCM10010178_19520 [Lentzea flava]
MKARIRKGVAALAVALSVAAAVVGGGGTSAAAPSGLRAFGISADGTLMATFTTDRPQVLDWVRTIQGFSGDTAAIGLDFRVQDGLMYLVGNKGGIYTVSLPYPPQYPEPVIKKVSQLTVGLQGTNFGVDFNPAADRLRVISDTGQNLRHDLNAHSTIADTMLTTPPTTGATKGVSAAAYTNNDLNPDTATTLFDIGTLTDQVLIQSPANNGTLAPTGSLTVNAGPNAGFDIYSTLSNGKAVSAAGFATLVGPDGTATLYSINLLTGEATAIGKFPLAITDLAISLTGS